MPETRGLCLSEEQTVSTVRITSLICVICISFPWKNNFELLKSYLLVGFEKTKKWDGKPGP